VPKINYTLQSLFAYGAMQTNEGILEKSTIESLETNASI
jgi:hypothetical protein